MEDRSVSVNELHRLMLEHPEINWEKIVHLIVEERELSRKKEKELWMAHAHRRAVQTGWDEAHELFKF